MAQIDSQALLAYIKDREEIWEDIDEDRYKELKYLERWVKEQEGEQNG